MKAYGAVEAQLYTFSTSVLQLSLQLQSHAVILIRQLLNTAHCRSQHGPATAWLTSEWPLNGTPFPKTFPLLGAY